MNGLDLFSGVGGISLALEPWVRTIAYCEQDRYAQGVLMSRMRDGSLDPAPIWDDVRTLSRKQIVDQVDIIFGGFPCQDISSAGRGAGLEGNRSGLFFEIIRLVDELRPNFVFLENVPAITFRGLDEVVGALSGLRYDCRWTVISAAELGACHLRKRWFLLAADASSKRFGEKRRLRRLESTQRTSCGNTKTPDSDRIDIRIESNEFAESETQIFSRCDERERNSADADGSRLERKRRGSELARPAIYDGWKSQPTIRRGDHGFPNRVDRVRCLGNAVVPLQAREAFKRLSGIGE